MVVEKAAFGAGCFWHVQVSFDKLKGILKTEVGYMGGNLKNPSYEDVCSDKSGHAEVVYIEYDSEKISYEKLLDLFWKIHDPTALNRQGPDIGTQYKSVIFYYNEKQKELALKSEKEIQKKLKREIITQVIQASTFYKAEEYHQKYFLKHGKVC